VKIPFAKSAVVVLFSLVFAIAGAAQETCELALKRAPLLLNLQIGMTPEQTQNAFGKDLKVKIKKKGERTFFQNYIKNPAPAALSGIRALYLRFFNGQLYQIELFYEPRPDLTTLEAITNALSSQLNFSVSDWKMKNNRAEIVCGETSIVADNVLNPRIELTDEIVRARIKELREKDKK
jgi:hypothetical protein